MTMPVGFITEDPLGWIQKFTVPATVTNLQWQTWRKPLGVSMVNVICIGGGAGGGGGAVGAGAGSGGGAGSSGITRVTVPAFLIPDSLYIQVGAGGAGVTASQGGSGILSYVAIAPDITASNVLAVSGNAATVGGVTGTAGIDGGAGAGGSIATIANMPLAGLGHFDLIAGQVGKAGSSTSHAIPVTSTLSGGGNAGGGGGGGSGGSYAAIAGSFLSEQRAALTTTGVLETPSGNTLWKPFFNFGGNGGSQGGTTGAPGGHGAYGGGGGGGGVGSTTGGKGGDGGNGIVLITCW